MNRIRPQVCCTESHNRKRGFALVVALSLMAFILLLLISLSAIVRVETQSSYIQLEQLLARQNALLGAYVAVGNLQKYAGPDQRVTARADILSASNPDKSKWTGVWKDPDPNNPADQPTLLAWLVSGNNPDNTSANSANSIAIIGAQSGLISSGAAADEVYAEPVNILDLVGNARAQFGYWVADEGVKAKVNITDNYRDTTDPASPGFSGSVDWNHLVRRSVIPQRTGVERVSGANNQAPSEELLELFANQNSMADFGVLGAPWEDLPTQHFHDLTIRHYGILSDPKNGGLKKDLSRGLYDQTAQLTGTLFDATPYPNEPTWAVLQSYAQTIAPILGDAAPSIGARPHILNQVMDSYNSSAGTATFGTNPFASNVADISIPDQHGFGPIIYQAAIEIWYRFIRDPFGSIALDGTPNYRLELAVQPVFMLANPYNVVLNCPEMRVSYNFAMDDPDSGFGFGGTTMSNYADPSYAGAYTSDEFLQYKWVDLLGNQFASDVAFGGQLNKPWFNFIIPAVTYGPGEVKLFTRGGPDASAESSYTGPSEMEDEWGRTLEALDNYLEEGLNGDGTLFRFPHASPKLVSQQFLENEFIYFWTHQDFIELNNGVNGKNPILHLEILDTNRDPNDFGAPLARIERVSGGPDRNFAKSVGTRWTTNPQHWQVRDKGRGIIAQNYGLHNRAYMRSGGEAVRRWDGLNPQNQIFWLRDHNIRYPFSSDEDGLGTPGADPRRNYQLYGKTNNYEFFEDTLNNYSFPAQLFWGANDLPAGAGLPDGWTYKPLFNVLTEPLYSIAQLQHANLAASDRFFSTAVGDTRALATLGDINGRSIYQVENRPNFPSVGIGQPSYLVGHSTRDPSVGINDIFSDFIYQTNNVLWDTYFVSSMANSYDLNAMNEEYFGTSEVDEISNKRMRLYYPSPSSGVFSASDLNEIKDFDTAAAHRLVDGAFNINSTSVEAWRAFLSSLNAMTPAVAPYNSSSMRQGDILSNSFPNFSTPNADSPTDDGPSSDARWQSHLALSNQEIGDLAVNIVARLKQREGQPAGAPFTSLADFINRLPGEEAGFLDKILQPEWFPGSDDDSELVWNSPGNSSPNEEFINDYEASVGSPGVLHQANLLQAIGPFIQVRSDTFTVWSYGNSLDPISGDVLSESLIELVVQRTPNFMDSTDSPDTQLSSLASNLNLDFGRDFEIISIREHSL